MLDELKGNLIVSCQALEDEPLHSSFIMSRMAIAAKQGGAKGIRAQSVKDINAIMETCDLPVIGIVKRWYPDSDVFITPTRKEVYDLLSTKCEIIAVDATLRQRPNNEDLKALVDLIHEGHRYAMADCSTFEECVNAEALGFDIVSTTLCGYTPYSTQIDGPDFGLIKRIVAELKVPIIVEGKINTPQDLKDVFSISGVFSAVVGGAITRPQQITARFVNALSSKGENEFV